MSGGLGEQRLPTRREIDACAGRPLDLDSHLAALADAASSGDREAVEMLIYAIDSQRLAEPGIRRVLFEPDDVEEVVQDVLIAVAEQVDRFRNESRFTSWLFGIGCNKALEFLRNKRHMSEFRTELGDSERISSLIANEISVQELLSSLPSHYRLAVTMRDLQRTAYADIAGTLNLNLNTVRAHISRGRALLAAAASGAAE